MYEIKKCLNFFCASHKHKATTFSTKLNKINIRSDLFPSYYIHQLYMYYTNSVKKKN